MKYVRYITPFLVLTIVVSVSSCAQYANKHATNERLCGKWIWQRSSGGFTGKQEMTPETKGYTKVIQFTPFGEYLEYHNDSLVVTVGYTVERKKTIFGYDHEVICFSDSAGTMMDQVIMRLDDRELHLADPCPDCFGHAYIRMEWGK